MNSVFVLCVIAGVAYLASRIYKETKNKAKMKEYDLTKYEVTTFYKPVIIALVILVVLSAYVLVWGLQNKSEVHSSIGVVMLFSGIAEIYYAYNEMRQKKCDGYMRHGMASRDTYYYKDVYVGCARALDFLCSLPEWDGKNAIVTGGSQGGALTIITAALNEKATVCAPFYPALCDLTGFLHHRAGGWPKFFSGFYKDGQIDIPQEQAVSTLQYYDVVNFARHLTIPTFMSWGYSDDTCSPTSIWAAWNEITAPKANDITPSSGHWRFPASWEKCWQWIKNHINTNQ